MSIYIFLLNHLDTIDDIKNYIKKIYYVDAIYDEHITWLLSDEDTNEIEKCWKDENKISFHCRVSPSGYTHYKYSVNGLTLNARPFGGDNPLSNIIWACNYLQITNFIGSKTDLLCRKIYLNNQDNFEYNKRKRNPIGDW